VTPDLILDAAAGSREAFEILFERHAATMKSILDAHGCPPENIDDVLQDIFVDVWFARVRLIPNPHKVRGLFAQATRNRVRKYRRTGARLTRFLRDFGSLQKAVRDRYERSVSARTESEPDVARLRRVFGDLPVRDRLVLRLHWFHGLPTREVAEALGTTRGAVKKARSRAYTRIRALIEEEERSGEETPIRRSQDPPGDSPDP